MEMDGSVLVADPDFMCPGLKIDGLFSRISAAVLEGDNTSMQISGARVRQTAFLTSWVRSLLTQATSTALTPSEVESGHSVSTIPWGSNRSNREPT
jgi:hypothetical protein